MSRLKTSRLKTYIRDITCCVTWRLQPWHGASICDRTHSCVSWRNHVRHVSLVTRKKVKRLLIRGLCYEHICATCFACDTQESLPVTWRHHVRHVSLVTRVTSHMNEFRLGPASRHIRVRHVSLVTRKKVYQLQHGKVGQSQHIWAHNRAHQWVLALLWTHMALMYLNCTTIQPFLIHTREPTNK